MAPTSAYSANPVKPITTKELSNGLLFGNHIGLVTAVQSRNNARLHHREDGSQPAKMLSDAKRGDLPIMLYPDAEVARDSHVYRVKDNLTYSLDFHEIKDGIWVPYKADDVQLEFVMLDPYVCTTLSHDDQGHFSAPDVYGIYLFPVLYRRLGLWTIFTTTQVSLRPFKHDEYEGFIPAAYPYYASAFSMMVEHIPNDNDATSKRKRAIQQVASVETRVKVIMWMVKDAEENGEKGFAVRAIKNFQADFRGEYKVCVGFFC
ncbi:hypothetical protein PsorP6_016469 [Peronosclerospora sorghi]|uniref:Uncharacterized protein n=1 Tax=Peronosclerospora sorghi TaxID=230839 RepID=A0ACC0VLU4_9STRA|nr:hypothetical protein PsorP6_016469 [Peronosclerospora sorghi]